MSGCLDEDQLLAYALHRLSAEDRVTTERHLESCATCFEIVAALVGARAVIAPDLVDTTEEATANASPRSLAHPLALGRYRLLDRIGEGGMGVVYRAFDPHLQRHVALKVIRDEGRPATVAELLRAKLLDEAHTMARLTHPNVITVFDVGRDGEQIFVAMELIDGETLRDWQRREPRSWRALTMAYLEAARGLGEVHASGIVHRDFKPENVLVSGNRVIVTDFGLACRDEAAVESAAGLAGTPAYMSPEQFRGEAADARSDLFAFCAALWEALHGVTAFEGEDLPSRRAAVLEGRMRATPKEARVPRWLRAVLLRGMAPAREARPQSMEQLTAMIRRGLQPPRRRTLSLITLGAASLALCSSLAWMARAPLIGCHRNARAAGRRWSDARKQRLQQALQRSGLPFSAATWRTVEVLVDRYVERLGRSYADACDALHQGGVLSAETFERRLQCLDDRRITLEKVGALLDEGDRAVTTEAVGAMAHLEPVEACASLTSFGQPIPAPTDAASRNALRQAHTLAAETRGLQLVGRYGDAFARANELVAQARTLAFAPAQAEAALLLGDIERDRGRWREAEAAYISSIESAERGRCDAVRLRAMTELLGAVGHLEGHIEEGQRWARQAEALLGRLDQPPLEAAQLAMRRGLLRLSQGRLDEAEADLRHSLRLREQQPANSPLIAQAAANLATVLDTRGRYDEAERLYRQAYDRMRADYGAEHPRTLAVLLDLAGISYSRNDFPRALAQYEELLGPLSAALGNDHFTVAATMANMAGAYDYLGDQRSALQYGERALASVIHTAPDSPTRGALELNLSIYLRALGQFERAHALTRACLARRRAVLGPGHPLVGEAQYYEALIAIDEHHFVDALPDARAALALVERGYGKEHPRVADVLDAIGVIERETGQAAAALRAHQRALSIRHVSGGDAERATTLDQIGLDELALGDFDGATRALEEASRLRPAVADAKVRARTEFALARALVGKGATPPRALALARRALAAYTSGGVGFATRAAEVRRWIDRHQ